MQIRLPTGSLACFVALVLAAAPSAALACGFCHNLGGNALALPHPRAIEVAVATRAAIERGSLDDRRLVPRDTLPDGGTGLVPLHKVAAPAIVEAWAARLEQPGRDARPLAVHFLFIDTEQSCGLSARGGTVIFEAKPSFYCDARVVTTRAALLAVLDGTLSPAEAQKQRLLLIEGDRLTGGDIRAAALLAGGSQKSGE